MRGFLKLVLVLWVMTGIYSGMAATFVQKNESFIRLHSRTRQIGQKSLPLTDLSETCSPVLLECEKELETEDNNDKSFESSETGYKSVSIIHLKSDAETQDGAGLLHLSRNILYCNFRI